MPWMDEWRLEDRKFKPHFPQIAKVSQITYTALILFLHHQTTAPETIYLPGRA